MSLSRLKTPLLLVGLTLLALLVADLAAQGVAAATVVPPRMMLHADTAAAHPAAAQNPEIYVQTTQDLFGPKEVDVTQAGPNAPNQVTSAPQSEWDTWIEGDMLANIELLGTIVGTDDAIALVTSGPKQFALHLGERAGSWMVQDITDYSVTFEKGKERKTLMLASLTPPHPRTPTAMAPIQQQPQQVAARPTMHVRKKGNTIILEKNEVADALAHPERIMVGVRLEPIAKDGKPAGVKVAMLAPDNFFHYLGLEQNDTLLSINNQDMSTPEDAMQAYLTLKNESALTIKVDRGGTPVTIPVEVR